MLVGLSLTVLSCGTILLSGLVGIGAEIIVWAALKEFLCRFRVFMEGIRHSLDWDGILEQRMLCKRTALFIICEKPGVFYCAAVDQHEKAPVLS